MNKPMLAGGPNFHLEREWSWEILSMHLREVHGLEPVGDLEAIHREAHRDDPPPARFRGRNCPRCGMFYSPGSGCRHR